MEDWDLESARSFKDREEAGRQLAKALAAYAKGEDVVVLALPRGGVPVGYEIAKALEVPLDVLVVRKLGFPGHEELAMGAVASGGVVVYNRDVVSVLSEAEERVPQLVAKALEEVVRREKIFRAGRPAVEVWDKRVILVDDGIATGATMRAAVNALRELGVEKIVVAVPVASMEAYAMLQDCVDEVVCLSVPEHFAAVGQFYANFSQTSDQEVIQLLAAAQSEEEKRSSLRQGFLLRQGFGGQAGGQAGGHGKGKKGK